MGIPPTKDGRLSTTGVLQPRSSSRRPGISSCSFYFARLSIDEEGFYCAVPEAIADEIHKMIGAVPQAGAIVDAYKELATIDLLALLNSPRLEIEEGHLHKLYQTGLNAIPAFYVQHKLQLHVDAVGFYSGGVTSAFMFAGSYTASDYIRHVFPFNQLVRERMAAEGRPRNLTQVLLAGDVGDRIDEFVSHLVGRDPQFCEVFIKDHRQPHTLLVAGPIEPMKLLVGKVEERFTAVAARRSPILKHRFASHSPYVDFETLSMDLNERVFCSSKVSFVGTRGELLGADRGKQSEMRRVFANGVIGPMDTGRAIEELARQNKRILVIGSAHAAKVLAGFHLPLDVSIDLALEFVAGNDSRILGRPIYDGRVTEYAAG
jgi:hypothetical protein